MAAAITNPGLKHSTFISPIPVLVVLITMLNSHLAISFDLDDDEPDIYVLDEVSPMLNQTLSSRSRFLVSEYRKIRKGLHCNVMSYNVCDGVWANNGTSLLHCCKNHCRNVLGDWNNCGECGCRCRFGQRCCGGVCTDVSFNSDHCGKCRNRCLPGVACEFGSCGYA